MIRISNQNGRTAVELLLVMVLLLLFSMAALTLVASGSETYIDTVEKGNNQSALRIAQSYFHTKLRQNNVAGAIYLKQFDGVERKCLVIEDIEYHSDFVTVIYVKNGKLYETLIPVDGKLDPDMSFEICSIEGFEITEQSGGILLKTWLMSENQEKSLQSFIGIHLKETP